ncbi:MAG: ribose-phosphate diphosphokinase [Gammaproteobacteria bacterium]|nr:ribose-phosphate diphosphokinase [Gammaproteobacteria bacterium]
MDNMIIFSMPENMQLTKSLADKLKIEIGIAEFHSFPDGETYVRIESDVKDKAILLICSLDHPNNKICPLLFMARTLKALGAKKIYLVSPYLPYMRQDKQFKPGEAVTSALFAQLLSGFIDHLITIDPHLHRIKHLSEIYSIPTTTLHATKLVATWIKNNVDSPFIIGPDEESEQWVSLVAKEVNASYAIIKKTRYGDRDVKITVPEINDTSKTPVLVDDIISTGTSMIMAIEQLLLRNFKNPICIVVHALFDQKVEENLMRAGAKQIVSCNTIVNPSNQIDVSDLIIEGIKA